MTNRERYKQAFSALQTSGKISLEVEDMAKLQKKHKKISQRRQQSRAQLLSAFREPFTRRISAAFRRRSLYGCTVKKRKW